MTSDGLGPGSPGSRSQRGHLLSVAFRMLGTMADAEDALQEAYVRWYRQTDEQRAEIRVPQAWMTTALVRICLSMLSAAPRRRERYVGEWLPEPVPAFALALTSPDVDDPAERVALDDSVSSALLVVLDALTPAERIAFVMHDVFAVPFDEIAEMVERTPAACRQLATSARRKVQQERDSRASVAQHDDVVRAFAAAARTGDLAGLMSVLDPRVVLRSDGGGVVSAARRPVVGAEKVARFLAGLSQRSGHVSVEEERTSDGLGFVLRDAGRVTGVITMTVVSEAVVAIRIMLNPAKLTLWR